tara:strand:+ start:463 stop:1953 length:1491 start_codon:yes stop_codon:yes gene_type:complete
MLFQKNKITSLCNKYYNKVIENFSKNNIFYIYNNNRTSYKNASNKIKKFIKFFQQNKKRLNIVVYCDKSEELYSLIQAIFLSDNVFIPISKNTPVKRIISMLSNIKIDYFIYDNFEEKIIFNKLKKKFNIKNIKEINKFSISRKTILTNSIQDYNNTAMIYYTSGSTGVPKGTKISHYNYIKDFFLQKKHLYKNISKKLIFGDYHETSFSIFFDIYFPAVFFGSALCPAKTFFEKTEIIDHLKKNSINVLITVPSSIQRISGLYKKLNLKEEIKLMIITGETFYLNQLRYLFNNMKINNLYNCYGSTELSNWVFFHKCKKKDLITFQKYNLVPIGKIFNSIKYKLKDKILHIGGDVVSKGYLEKSQNKNKFYQSNNLNWYNTEDRVIKFKNIFICKGRNKNIIKIFGYRVDLSDIETNIRKIKNINEAYCLKKVTGYREDIIAIINYFEEFDEKKIQKSLCDYLPKYMIPKKIIALKKFPLNNNGKVDRGKLRSVH